MVTTYLLWVYIISAIITAFVMIRPEKMEHVKESLKELAIKKRGKYNPIRVELTSLVSIFIVILLPFLNSFTALACTIAWAAHVKPKE
jgi:hypothetical protein